MDRLTGLCMIEPDLVFTGMLDNIKDLPGTASWIFLVPVGGGDVDVDFGRLASVGNLGPLPVESWLAAG